MSVDCIHINGLPIGIQEEDLKTQLLKSIPVFSKYKNELSVSVFHAHNKTTAVVSGFSSNYEHLMITFRKCLIKISSSNLPGKAVRIKPDTGEERAKDGNFLYARSRSMSRSFSKLAGVPPRKVTGVFQDKVLRELQLKERFKTLLFVDEVLPHQLNKFLFGKPGRYTSITCNKAGNGSVVGYASELEAFQALTLLNRNKSALKHPNGLQNDATLVFSDVESTFTQSEHCRFEKNVGLGHGGECINLGDYAEKLGYIPFNQFSSAIIDLEFLRKSANSVQCLTHKRGFKLLGITLYGNSIAAICEECTYTRNCSEINPNRGVSYPGEAYTRLILSKSMLPDERPFQNPNFCLQYSPLKRKYENKTEYGVVNAALLKEEWKFCSRQFKAEYKTKGHVKKFKLVEENKDGTSTMALQIQICQDGEKSIWKADNPKSVMLVNIMYKVQNEIEDRWKCVKNLLVCKITSTCNSVVIQLQKDLGGEDRNHLKEGTDVDVIPKANKAEFNATNSALRNWISKSKDNDLTKAILDPFCPFDWNVKRNITLKGIPESKQILIDEFLRSSFNQQQMDAFDLAIKSSVSIAHGCPGGGKTTFLAKTINALFHMEEGKILVCAPSNDAADNISESIINCGIPGFTKPTVLRIYAPSKETNTAAGSFNCPTLHKLMKLETDWLRTKDVEGIKHRIEENQFALLSKKELKVYNCHKMQMESKIVTEYDILVMTVGAVSERRMKKWGDDLNITTVVLDEAGQLLHTQTVILDLLLAPRYIIAGDPMQLPPTVLSKAAQYAGFDISLLEMISFSAMIRSPHRNTLPYTCLFTNNRMHPAICSLISKAFYCDQLKTSQTVIDRVLSLNLKRLDALVKGNRILMWNTNGQETEENGSYYNTGEIELIVTNLKYLKQKGISFDNWQVLTMYQAQNTRLKAALAEESLELCVCNTDAYQGKECDVTILSLCRANLKGDIGFTRVPNRINVAMSRAKEFLIICGNLHIYEGCQLQHWKTVTSVLRKSLGTSTIN